MPVRLGLEVVWIPQPAVVANAYFATAEHASHLVEPMAEATELAATEIDLNFEYEGRPDHWAGLAPATLYRRVNEAIRGTVGGFSELHKGTSEFQSSIRSAFGGSMKILQRTGSLRAASVDPGSWAMSGGGQEVVAVLTDPTGYGIFHITGAPGNNMPQRDYTYISDAAVDEMETIFADWVMQPWEAEL